MIYNSNYASLTRIVVDSTGTVQAKYSYFPFGDNLASWISQGTDYKFTGKELDEESGFNLYYFGARYYDAKIARWVSVDPAMEKYPNFSPYVYSLDNPVKIKDPDGKAAVIVLGAAGVGMGVTTATGVAITITTIAAANHCIRYQMDPKYRASVDAGTMSMGKAISGAFGSVVEFARQATSPKQLNQRELARTKGRMTEQNKTSGPNPLDPYKVVPTIYGAQKAIDKFASGVEGAVNHPLLSKVITAASELAGVASPAVPAATQVATEIGQTIASQGQSGEKADQPQQNENTPNAPPPPDEDKEPKKEKQPVLQDAWERDLLWDAF